jgi:hypothetical protein
MEKGLNAFVPLHGHFEPLIYSVSVVRVRDINHAFIPKRIDVKNSRNLRRHQIAIALPQDARIVPTDGALRRFPQNSPKEVAFVSHLLNHTLQRIGSCLRCEIVVKTDILPKICDLSQARHIPSGQGVVEGASQIDEEVPTDTQGTIDFGEADCHLKRVIYVVPKEEMPPTHHPLRSEGYALITLLNKKPDDATVACNAKLPH